MKVVGGADSGYQQGHVSRRIEDVARRLLSEEPVLALHGPRAVGKTTLLRSIAASRGVGVVDLDDLATRKAVAEDPAAFVSGRAPVCIDEYQHVPPILDAIKAELNLNGSPGRFLITGSTRHDALPLMAQSLTGRLHRMTVHPLSQSEIAGVDVNLISNLFSDPAAIVSARRSSTTRDEYVARVAAGGFPAALRRTTAAARSRWFGDYVSLCLERDVAELARIQQKATLPGLLTRLVAQTGQILNVSAAGAEAGLNKRTADNYTKLLEALFLVYRVPAWGKTLRARAVAMPKLHVVDSGLAAHLLRLSPEKLGRLEPTALQQFGHLFETFVVGEVHKQLSLMDGIAAVGHWRTHDGAEVDLVIERDDGSVIAIEIKAGSRVGDNDMAGLRVIRNALGDAFVAGAVMYAGEWSYTSKDGILVLPVDCLWTPMEKIG